MKDFETQQQTIETAAEREAHYWKGQALKPFSFLRQAAAQRIGAEGASLLENAVLLIYLCTLEPKDIDPVRGEDAIAAFRLRMNDWADREGITLAGGRQVLEAANAIWLEMESCEFKLAPKPGEKSESAPPNG